MKKFLDSGAAFLVVALLCLLAAVFADNGAVFVSIGAFWLIMAIITRSRNTRKSDADSDNPTP